MKFKINAPWTNDKNRSLENWLDFIKFSKDQLIFFQKQKDSQHIKNDIEGYNLILESKNEENAKKFLEIKQNARRNGKRFEDNLDVIKFMKINGIWK